ncbi:MAG TPA: metallophosphoesterase [Pyrinomonadaceae bacterium]|jgi:hypothetical protein|nr:metallophosphoesterase [Pyrinomonadaceae bacterium]
MTLGPRVKRRLRVALYLALLSVCVLAVWAFLVEPALLVVNREELSLGRTPPALRGLKVAAVSDIHAGSPHVDIEKINRLVEETNRLQPDIVVLLGDYVIQDVAGGHFIEPEATAECLSRLRAPLGVFAVLGNHDWWLDGERVRRALTNVGIRVLENDAARVTRDGRPLWIAGLADLWTRSPDARKTLAAVNDPDDAPVILLTHNPDVFPDVPARVSLTLAGHTHGGQVNLPLLGRPVVPSRFEQLYAYGHVVEGGRHLFVTSGVGTSILPVRFRVPPEITLLTIND